MTKSAEQGYFVAQYAMGYFYESGTGFEKDLEKAKYWYNKAADQGYYQAIEALRKLREEKK